MYPTSIRSTGIGWAMGMGRVGQLFGPFLTGLLVALGWKVGGIFYATAVPCFIGAVFLLLLVFGAKRLPEMGRSLGDGMRGFKDAIGGESPQPTALATQQPRQSRGCRCRNRSVCDSSG